MTAVHAAEQMQVPLLAVVLLGACAAKLARAFRTRSVLAFDATGLFPPRLRRPAAMAVALSELSLGAGILVTSGRAWHSWAAGAGDLPVLPDRHVCDSRVAGVAARRQLRVLR